jgi:predicted porin
MRLPVYLLASLSLACATQAVAGQEPGPESSVDSTVIEPGEEQIDEDAGEELHDAVRAEVDTNEDPEAKRRAQRELQEQQEVKTFDFDLNGSVRIHAINAYDMETGTNENTLGDGASRIGASGSWQFSQGWNLFGRLEYGFDILDTVTPKAQNESGGKLAPRLHSLGLESDALYVKYGKSWSTYYQVAGAADRFAIFGGSASGVYNAGTDGGATGTGRADNALQTFVFLDLSRWTGIKPFKLNAQYQQGESIPHTNGLKYGSALSLSAWFETERNLGIGLAWHDATIQSSDRQALEQLGIDGDARALALAFKAYGKRWLTSLVLVKMENVETTDKNIYFNGTGVELFAQWEFHDHWWLIGGGNLLKPDGDDPQVGEYEVKYAVLGLRYTPDSFRRMLYLEWRDDYGSRTDGRPNENEVTIGFRWDFD